MSFEMCREEWRRRQTNHRLNTIYSRIMLNANICVENLNLRLRHHFAFRISIEWSSTCIWTSYYVWSFIDIVHISNCQGFFFSLLSSHFVRLSFLLCIYYLPAISVRVWAIENGTLWAVRIAAWLLNRAIFSLQTNEAIKWVLGYTPSRDWCGCGFSIIIYFRHWAWTARRCRVSY